MTMDDKSMKQTDIKPCGLCGNGLAHDNNIAFYRVKIDHMVLNVGAIQRQHGLEMMLGGHAAIAHAMGPQEDIALCASAAEILVCQDCFIHAHAAVIWEAAAENAEVAEAEDS